MQKLAGRGLALVAVAVLAAATASCIGGCGSGGGTTSTTAEAPSEATIIREAGFTTEISYGVPEITGPGRCRVIVVLNSPQEIDLYRSAGDTVVTDPTGTVGAKVDNERGCPRVIEESLRGVQVGG